MLLNESQFGKGAIKKYNFLRLRHIGSGVDLEIVDFREADASMDYSDYLLDVKFKGRVLSHGFRTKNEDLQNLVAEWGLDTDKWKGKIVRATPEDYISESTGKKSIIIRIRAKKSSK